MKLISHNFEKDTSGSVTLKAEDKEDLFTLYNLIQKRDEIRLKTFRNIKKEGKSKADKKLLTLTVSVEDMDFIPEDENMRIKGKTTTPTEDVPVDSYHSFEIDYQYPFTLKKDSWDAVSVEVLQTACNTDNKAEMGAVVLQEGVAHICLITQNMTMLKTKIEKPIPKKKRGDSKDHDKSLDKFITLTAETVIRDLNLDNLKAVVLASPGFLARNLYDKIFQIATSQNDKVLHSHKAKFVVTHSSTGYLQGLEEVLKNEEVQKKLSDTKFAKDVLILDEFFKRLNDDDCTAWYGPQECKKAVEMGAVKNLLITDSLFRSDDISKRQQYIELSDLVRSTGGDVNVFSSLHESGKQVDQVTGVAVILKYPVPDLDEEEEEEQ
ncbi:hypothetical protein WICPIJ_002368 [Wickerhamomyces pijperi]|uniref:Protein DOM34 homolog n=1 Tax=Wickerhamomyces pijperi TaxID=599730 RepID=A0A9P8TPW4_WICPI|nr:hypothetical protein WICPIJ_002368 [Wickerhamomyces pijperi]